MNSDNESLPPEYLQYVEDAVANSQSVFDIAETALLRYVGANHYSMAQTIHPYREFDLFKNVPGWKRDVSASGYRAHERFALKTLAIIREEINRLEADRFSSSRTLPDRKGTFQSVSVAMAFLLSTADRIRSVTAFLKDALPAFEDQDDQQLLKDLDAFLSTVDCTPFRQHFGLPVSQDRLLTRTDPEVVGPAAGPSNARHTPSEKHQLTCSFGDIEALQDLALFHYLEVKQRWCSVVNQAQTFSRDDLGMLRLVLQDEIMTSKDHAPMTDEQTGFVDQLVGLDEHFSRILVRAPTTFQGKLATIGIKGDGEVSRLEVESPYAP